MTGDPTQFAVQAVEAARFSARVLVTISAASLALILFGQGNPYEEAAEELDVLLAANYRVILNEFAVRNIPEVSREINLMRDILDGYGLSLTFSQGNALLSETTVPRVFRSEAVGVDLELIDADVYRPGNLLRGEVSDITSAEPGLRQLLDEQRTWIPAEFKEVWVDFDRPRTGAVVRIGWGGGRGNAGHIQRELGVEIGATDFERPLNWPEVLAAFPETTALIENTDGRPLFLPRTKDQRVWGQVRDRNATDAREYLSGLANARENALLLFGLSVPENRVSWVVPLLMFAFGLHLFMHIRHLIAVIPRSNIDEYPWLPLMRVWGSGFYTFLMLVFLPLFTLGSIFFFLESTMLQKVASAFLSIGAAACIVFSYLMLHRSMIHR